MTQLDDIKTVIAKLSDEEVVRLREWLAELDAQRFDDRIERDAATGKLDRLMEQAKANHAAGRRREL
jgi:hypothetical protein